MRRICCIGLILLCSVPLLAQKEKREPLTEAQVEQIREAGVDPDGRVKLYTKFLDEDVDNLKALGKRVKSAARSHRMNEELQDFSALIDELGSNLDTYGERKADMRKALKALSETAPHWLEMLRAIPSEPGFELTLKEAVESAQDLSEQATTLLKEQTEYFNVHKDEQGQDRAEPKSQ